MKTIWQAIRGIFIGQPLPGSLLTSSLGGFGWPALIERLRLGKKSKSLF